MSDDKTAILATVIRNALSRPPLDIDCDGSYDCSATDHIHGCFNDDPCQHPEEMR